MFKQPCPKCGKKGLHYGNHPHAYGFKDYSRVVCRFCKTKFKHKEKIDTPKEEAVCQKL